MWRDKQAGCRVPGRQSPAAEANMWFSSGDRAACRDSMFVSVIGAHVSSKL